MPYCVCGDLDVEHPTYHGCTVFRRIADHEQLAAVLLKDVPSERRQGALENMGLEPGGKVHAPKPARVAATEVPGLKVDEGAGDADCG